MKSQPLLLASSSPYRRELLQRLGLPFTCASPGIDESIQPGESAEGLAIRLAAEKAGALAPTHPGHWIIGSDQVACLPDGTILNKPGNHEAAIRQLIRSSGQQVSFLTGLALINADTGAAPLRAISGSRLPQPPAASRWRAWASRCSNPLKAGTRTAWSACR